MLCTFIYYFPRKLQEENGIVIKDPADLPCFRVTKRAGEYGEEQVNRVSMNRTGRKSK